MTDIPEMTDDERLADEARVIVATTPDPVIPDAVGLPDDVHDGVIDDDAVPDPAQGIEDDDGEEG